jgi:hypothetical protein
VWFPHYGWQSFDPTAVVPLANPSPGATLFHDIGRLLHALPLVPLATILILLVAAAVVVRWRRRRPATWALAVARRMEHAGARAGRPRRADETLTEYGAVLDDLARDPSRTWSALASVVEASAYGSHEPSADDRARAERVGRSIRVDRSRSLAKVGADRQNETVRPAAVPVPRRASPAAPPTGENPSADGVD